MRKPVLMAVDDDREVLAAVVRDLQSQYRKDYRVLGAAMGAEALDLLRQLKLRDDPVALLLVDQRMPRMTGVEFLEQARELFPDARRVLLTAYADTDAAIKAINGVQIHYYLLKPWEPPNENLYPIIEDQLDDWQASYRPAFEGPRIVGNRWSPQSFRVRDFLARNRVPYQWFDAEAEAEARKLIVSAGLERPRLPLVVFADGSFLQQPDNLELAGKIGLRTQAQKQFYDLLIVGGGPAGLAAAVYGSSEGLSTALIEREAPGGQAGTSSRIENYLGFPSGISGGELARRGVTQARKFGVEILAPQEVRGVRVEDPARVVTLGDGSEIGCHALLIAAGVTYRRLDVPGLERLTGAGVYYGSAMTEALACKDQDVIVVGGANSAGQGAMYLAQFAHKVIILVRGDSLAKGMSQYLVDQIEQTPNIEVRLSSRVVEAHGEVALEGVSVAHAATGAVERLSISGLFVFIGAMPRTEWLDGIVARDSHGFILTGPDLFLDDPRRTGWKLDRDPLPLETSTPGLFAAGDVRHQSMKRIASAVGEGAMAVALIHQYLRLM